MAITKIGTPELFDFSATNTALQLPTGDTASRPSAPSAGQWRFNTTLKYVEYYDGAAWFQIDTEAPASPDDFPSQNFNVNTYFGTGATQTIDAKFNEAANFGSSTSNVILADNSIFDGTGPWSMSFWANIKKYGGTSNRMFLLDKPGGVGNYGWQLEYDNSGIGFKFQIFDTSNNDATITVGANTALNTWVNVVITISSGSVAKIYLDKTLKDTSSAIGTISTNDANVNIGDYSLASGYNYEGSLDQLRFFNQELNQTQINSLYDDETTTTAATLDFPVGAGCVAAYPFDGDASDVGGTYGGLETDIGYTGLKFQADFIWIKSRNASADHTLTDSVRGVQQLLSSNSNAAEGNQSPNGMTNFGANSFSVTDNSGGGSGVNGAAGGANSGTPPGYVAWCFKAGGAPTATNSNTSGSMTADSVSIDGTLQAAYTPSSTIYPKKISINTENGLSIVQYQGTGSTATVEHGLGLVPKLILTKVTSVSGNSWACYTEATGIDKYLELNQSNSAGSYTGYWGSSLPTTSVFGVVNGNYNNNYSGENIIAYSFADIANYQKIGSYTGTNAPGNIISTEITSGDGGFEPAFVMIKLTSAANGNWIVFDNKRNSANPRTDVLKWDTNGSETTEAALDVTFTTNGFVLNGAAGAGGTGQINSSGETYIYLAIAADKDSSVPTLANSFSPTIYTGSGGTQNIYTPFAPDFTWIKGRSSGWPHRLQDSVRGPNLYLNSATTVNQVSSTNTVTSLNPNGFTLGADGNVNAGSGNTYVSWNWKAGGLPTINSDGTRTSIVSANAAAGFSIVKWTGDGAAATIGHGLGGAPGLIIVKKLTGTSDWPVYSSGLTSAAYRMILNDSVAENTTNDEWNSTDPTTVSPFVFSVGNGGNVSDNGQSFIGYCFADISTYQKVGSYNGSSSSVEETVGFQPRFVLIKNKDAVRRWVIFDSARNNFGSYLDPSDSLAEQTDSSIAITVTSTSFILPAGANYTINSSGYDYIYLAIA